MKCLGFDVRRYGVHDSNVVTPKLTVTKERCAIRYELELITSEDDGISCINGVPHTHERGLFKKATGQTPLQYRR